MGGWLFAKLLVDGGTSDHMSSQDGQLLLNENCQKVNPSLREKDCRRPLVEVLGDGHRVNIHFVRLACTKEVTGLFEQVRRR